MHFDELDSQPTDANLVCLALHGDTAAFDALDNRYRVTVYKYVYARVKQHHDAEEITQEVLIKAFEKLGTLAEPQKFLNWLYSIAANLVADKHRANQGRESFTNEYTYLEDMRGESIPISMQLQADNGAREEQIFGLVVRFPDEVQVMLRFKHAGMTDKKIALNMGMCQGRVTDLLAQAHTELDTWIEVEDADPIHSNTVERVFGLVIRLSNNARDVLLLRKAGRSYKEIAKALQISVGVVGNRLSRAIKQLKIWVETEALD